MENDFKDYHCIIDGSQGIYIPKQFADCLAYDCVKDIEKFEDDLNICKNPDHEYYWEAWENILDNMQIDLMGNGVFYSLYQDGDLFAVLYPD